MDGYNLCWKSPKFSKWINQVDTLGGGNSLDDPIAGSRFGVLSGGRVRQGFAIASRQAPPKFANDSALGGPRIELLVSAAIYGDHLQSL